MTCWGQRTGNALEVITGLFLHTARTPSNIIQLLSKIGLSISSSSIDRAIGSLVKQAAQRVRSEGQSCKMSIAFDNLDINIRCSVPTKDGRSSDELVHLCTATMLPVHLPAGVEWTDMDCATLIWRKLGYEKLVEKAQLREVFDHDKLEAAIDAMYPERGEERNDGSVDPSRLERFNQYLFLVAFVLHGPESFRDYKHRLDDPDIRPEVLYAIPPRKTQQVPMNTLDQEVGSNGGTIEAFAKFFSQMGIWDGQKMNDTPNLTHLGDRLIFVHADLGAAEKVHSMMRIRSAESRSELQFRNLIVLFGLFHLRMACSDAIWRIVLAKLPAYGKSDPNSFYSFLFQLRPKETGNFTTAKGAGHRKTHEVIKHIGIAMRLHLLEEYVAQLGFPSLDSFAQSKPSFEKLQYHAQILAASYSNSAAVLRMDPQTSADTSYSNFRLQYHLLSLYEDLNYGMNTGDIGRVECTFPSWIYIFKACGKHKYANWMSQTLRNLHFVYPTTVA
jgi:hypothetical protein